MVSPGKQRQQFSNLQEVNPVPVRQRTRVSETKYAASIDDDKKRLKRLLENIKHSLSPFYHNSNNTTNSTNATTIYQFLQRIQVQNGSCTDVRVNDFRKCLYALGISPDDSAFVLDALDRTRTGIIDGSLFTSKLLVSDDDQSTREFHQKVIERMLTRFPSVKDGFRQYDTMRTGLLSLDQFRTLMQDLGFSNTNDIEALIHFLDREQQQCIPYNSFSNTTIPNQSYTKISSPKKTRVEPLIQQESFHEEISIEEIRAKFRQRVMGRDKSIREIFMQFDDDSNGYLDHVEFRAFMAAYHFNERETLLTIAFLDQDGSGTIDYDEFAAGLLFYRPTPIQSIKERETHREQIMVTFINELLQQTSVINLETIWNEQNENRLTYQEFIHFIQGLHIKLSEDEIKVIASMIDSNHSQSIDCHQFITWLNVHSKQYQQNILPEKDLKQEDVGQERRKSVHFYRDDMKNQPIVREKVKKDENNESLGRRGSQIEEKSTGKDLSSNENSIKKNTGKDLDSNETSIKKIKGKYKILPTISKESAILEIFDKYDVDHSGILELEELNQFMRDYGFSENKILEIVKQVNEEEGIPYALFEQIVHTQGLVAISSQQTKTKSNMNQPHVSPSRRAKKETKDPENQWIQRLSRARRTLREAFQEHDVHWKGVLDHDEFRRLMKHYGMREDHDIDNVIARVDVDGEGFITIDAFELYFKRVKAGDHRPLPKKKIPKQMDPDVQERIKALEELQIVWMEEVLEHFNCMEDAFHQFDRQHTGELDYECFRDLMGQYGISEEANIRLMLQQLDTDHSGSVSLAEFKAVFNPKRLSKRGKQIKTGKQPLSKPPIVHNIVAEQAKMKGTRLRYLEETWIKNVLSQYPSIQAAFQVYDVDHSGGLDYNEFRQLLEGFGGGGIRETDVQAWISRLDLDHSGTIEYEEFKMIFHEGRIGQHLPETPIPLTDSETSAHTSAQLRELEKKWIRRVLSCHLSIEMAFREYDEDGNGSLDAFEFTHLMIRYGIVDPSDIDRIRQRLDLDGSGTIDLEEFMTVFYPQRIQGQIDEDIDQEELQSVLEIERVIAERMIKKTRDLRLAFRTFDSNGNGLLEYKEFRAALKAFKIPEPEIRRVIRHLDKDVSGCIDYREFITGCSLNEEKRKKTRSTLNY